MRITGLIHVRFKTVSYLRKDYEEDFNLSKDNMKKIFHQKYDDEH